MEQDIKDTLREHIQTLPEPVRRAIGSTDVEERLRTLAKNRQLHIDQWQSLENEVMLALIGLEPLSELADNISKEVGVDQKTAQELAGEVERLVFSPIREELERTLEHPEAKEKELSTAEKAQAAVSVEHKTATIVPQAPTVVRAPISDTYKPGEASTARPGTDGDPYREPVA